MLELLEAGASFLHRLVRNSEVHALLSQLLYNSMIVLPFTCLQFTFSVH